jgi:preprotein translocase subunit SecB
MAENDGQPAAAPAATAQPNMAIVAQYVKDLSFENPGAPDALRSRQPQPQINIQVGVRSNAIAENEYEVELRMDARAANGQTVLFALELVYAGLFRLTNIPPQNLAGLVMVECPRLLFPFARQIISDASRNGGFPPLLVDPVDFAALYRQQLQNAQAAQAQAGAPN